MSCSYLFFGVRTAFSQEVSVPPLYRHASYRVVLGSCILRPTSDTKKSWRPSLYNVILSMYNSLQKYLESFEMRCWRRMEKISWTDRVINEVSHSVKEEVNILQTMKTRKVNWIGHILRRNCLLKIRYWWKDKRKDRGDRKTRKKT
jgi:hypothetical protein